MSLTLSFNACSTDIFNKTAKCSDETIVKSVKELLTDNSREVEIDPKFIIQNSLNDESGLRTCEATVDYKYKKNENGNWATKIKEDFIDGYTKGTRITKNNKIIYTVILNDQGTNNIVKIIKD